DITMHNLHSLLDAFQSRRTVDMTIELQRVGDEEDDIALGYHRGQWPPPEEPEPRVTVATLQFTARITKVIPTTADSYELNFQVIGNTTQEVSDAARNFNVPKPRPARPPKSSPKRR